MRKSYQHFTRKGRKTILDEKVKAPETPTDSKSAQNWQHWQVWTQGPSELKHTKRKFKNTTPGQSRDYKDFVKGRRFKAFEEVEIEEGIKEDAPANSVAGGGVDMNPTGKERKLDGRTKDYRDVARRIKSRIEKKTQKETAEKLKAFGVGKPFGEETEMSNKYLTTKKGSIEASVFEALNTRVENPNDKLPTLTLSWRKDETEIDEAKRMSPSEIKTRLKNDRSIGVEKDPDTRRKRAAAGRDMRKETGKAAQALDKKADDRKADFKARLRKSVNTGAPLRGKNEETEIGNDLMASVVNEISKHAAKTKESDAERKYRENQEYDTARHNAKTRKNEEVDEAWKKDTMKKPSPGVKSGFKKKSTPDNYNPDTHTQAGSKQKKKPQFNTKTHRLISKNGKVSVVSKGDWAIKGKEMRKSGWVLAEYNKKEVGTDEYAKHTTDMTPGQPTNVQAKKKHADKKKEEIERNSFTKSGPNEIRSIRSYR